MSESLYTKIIGSTAPTSATVGVVGQWYLDSTTKKLYECKAVVTENDTTTYVWEEVGGGADEALRNNTVQIESSTGLYIGGAIKNSTDSRNIIVGLRATDGANSVASTSIGYESRAYSSGSTALGYNSHADSSGSTAIGEYASAGNSNSVCIGNSTQSVNGAIAIGYNVVAAGTGSIIMGNSSGRIQNLTNNTFQLNNDNIYNMSTHTLTVQNIALNGTDINTVIDNKIASAITTALNTPV